MRARVRLLLMVAATALALTLVDCSRNAKSDVSLRDASTPGHQLEGPPL